MKKVPSIFWLLVIIAGLAHSAGAQQPGNRVVPVKAYASAISPGETVPRTYLTATSATQQGLLDLRRELIAAGARHVNLFLPDIIVCEIPPGLDLSSVSGYRGVSRAEEASVQPYLAPGRSSRESWVRMCYERLDLSRLEFLDRMPGVSGEEVDEFNDVVVVSDPARVREVNRILSSAGGTDQKERGLHQNSEFFGGDILVQMVFPESNGEYESETEDWTDKELSDAKSAAIAGMLEIQASFPAMPMHFVFRYFDRAETGYEAIKHNMYEDGPWLIDVLRRIDPSLPYDGTFLSADITAHEFNNRGRVSMGTDFVFTTYVADSRNAPNNLFHGANYTAYARLGGPYQVTPFPAGLDPNNITDWMVFSKIYAHETGHVFWTLDEYRDAPGQCANSSGYLWYANNNKDSALIPGPDACDINGPFDCIMRYAAREDVGRPWCKWTRGQMGVIDNNNNSIPDIYDSEPVIQFLTTAVETTLTPDLTVGIKAISTAVPNRNEFLVNDRIDYAAPLKSATYNLLGLGPHKLDPEDGRWDDTAEKAYIRLNGLPAGKVTVAFKARNAVGVWSDEFTKTIYYIGVNFAQFTTTTESDGILLEWNVLDEQFGARFDVFRLEPGEQGDGTRFGINVQPAGAPVNGFEPYQFKDSEVMPGRNYRYYVVGRFNLNIGGETKFFRSKTDVIENQAMHPLSDGLVSNAAPNPFNSETQFSVAVPPSFIDQDGASGVPVYQQRVATAVEIAVYDVIGRRVKLLYRQETLNDVVTEVWDGTNEKGTQVPAGVYFIKVVAGGTDSVRKVLLIR
jgi:hypothetical protein